MVIDVSLAGVRTEEELTLHLSGPFICGPRTYGHHELLNAIPKAILYFTPFNVSARIAMTDEETDPLVNLYDIFGNFF